jgi:CRP-like cAMP-binding protein
MQAQATTAPPRAPAQTQLRNRLLRAVRAEEFAHLVPLLEPVRYEIRDVLIDYGRPISHVHFVDVGVVSNVSVMSEGGAIETATIGPEGVVGLAVALGADRQAAQAFCQVPGSGWRVDARAFAEVLPRLPSLGALLGRYTQALMTLVMQTSACNSVHLLRERTARWLLMTHDRVDGDSFALTHHFLSQMLGVRRASVTEAAGALASAGAIRYSHGLITVVDRTRLEGEACECYAVIAREFSRLLDGRDLTDPLRHVETEEGGRSVLGGGAPRGEGPPDPPEG